MSTIQTPRTLQVLRQNEPQPSEGFFAGTWQSLGDATYSMWSRGLSLTPKVHAPADPEWRWNEPTWRRMTEGLDERYWEYLDEAESMEQAVELRQLAFARQTIDSRVGSRGAAGLVGSMTAEFLNPVNIAAGAITGGGASLLRLGSAATRVSAMVRAGYIGAAGGALAELPRQINDPLSRPTDMILALTGGAAGGAGVVAGAGRGILRRVGYGAGAGFVGAFVPGVPIAAIDPDTTIGDILIMSATQAAFGAGQGIPDPNRHILTAARRLVDQIRIAEAEAMAGGNAANKPDVLTTKGVALKNESQKTPGLDRVLSVDAPGSEHNAPTDVLDVEPPPPGETVSDVADSSVGAATEKGVLAIPPDEPKNELDPDFSRTVSKPAVRWAGPIPRLSAWWMFGKNSTKVGNLLSRLLADDILSDNPNNGDSWTNANVRHWVLRAERAIGKGWRAYRKETGKLGISGRDEFASLVGRALKKTEFDADTPRSIIDTVHEIRRWYGDFARMAVRNKVRGTEGIDHEDPNYIPRIPNRPAWDRAVSSAGTNALDRFFANALMLDVSPETRVRIARHVREVVMGPRMARIGGVPGISGDDDAATRLAAVLMREGVSGDVIEQVMAAVMPKRNQSGVTPRLRHRLWLDENHTETIETLNGPVTLSIADLYEDNVHLLTRQYAQQMSGAIAMQEVYRVFAARTGGGEITSRQELIERFRVLASKEYGGAPTSKQARLIERQAEWFDLLTRRIMGQAINEPSRINTALRMVRQYSFPVAMNQIGFSQIGETATAVHELGIRAMLDGIKALGGKNGIIEIMATGDGAGPVSSEISHLFTVGADHFIDQPTARFDESDMTMVGRAESALQRMSKATNWVNGQYAIQGVQDIVNAAALYNWLLKAAESGKPLGKYRLRMLGLSEEMGERIMASIRKERIEVPHPLADGKTIGYMNIRSWKDVEAAAELRMAGQRFLRRVIIRQDFSTMSKWMTKPLAMTMLQFRRFALASHEKTLMYGIWNTDWRDPASVVNRLFGWSKMSLFALLGYSAQVYLNSLGRNDAEKYRERSLSVERLASASFSRAGYSAMFPAVIDSAAQWSGFHPIFQPSRGSGRARSADLLLGSPTAALAVNISEGSFGELLTAGLRPDVRVSGDAFRAGRTIIPYQNVLGLKAVFDNFQASMPRSTRQREYYIP